MNQVTDKQLKHRLAVTVKLVLTAMNINQRTAEA